MGVSGCKWVWELKWLWLVLSESGSVVVILVKVGLVLKCLEVYLFERVP